MIKTATQQEFFSDQELLAAATGDRVAPDRGPQPVAATPAKTPKPIGPKKPAMPEARAQLVVSADALAQRARREKKIRAGLIRLETWVPNSEKPRLKLAVAVARKNESEILAIGLRLALDQILSTS